ncbi:ATP-binding protein [Streptomyces sp. M600PL45_2]|uniref:ATP-binding protein n=1 Tax=Streptomyces marispadix TaxID=2922868 RepID=A0ABS9SXC0_9ACTN|nr:ATP-binding protein [Streptomyces marispadix]MCH6160925.1 ATP-binding protein [Streptomyces marispadix]
MRALQMRLEIGADPAEVGRARRWVGARLADCGIGDDGAAEKIVLLVSELVTNAVVHAGTPSVLRVLLNGLHVSGTVRVEVADLSTRTPRQRHAHDDETHGRGLELVAMLADRWGWQCEGLGKLVWCEVERAPCPSCAKDGCDSLSAAGGGNGAVPT